MSFDLFSIGHSNIPAERFVALLREAGVDAIADVRSTPFSGRFPWFSGKNLAATLAQHGMAYLAYGEALGGRPRDAALYRDGVADYEAMARQPDFQIALDRLTAPRAQCRVCLMCAEREPLDCHRCLLVARSLAERGLTIGHILHDGTVEQHAATERRLLALTGASDDLFVTGQDERLRGSVSPPRPCGGVPGEGGGGGEVRRGDEMMLAPVRALAVLLFLGAGSVLAQDAGTQNRAASTVDTTPPGTLEKVALPPLANPDAPNIPAKELFARKLTPLAGPARAIGGYAKGCMAGAEELPITGPTWQVMRLSRNRNWGNPELIDFIKRFGDNAKKAGWNGLLIGDMAQPRGGPMLSGHASHQIGLDADIWFSPMPDHVLSREEREMTGAVNMVAPSGLDVDHSLWTPVHTALVKAAAEDPEIARIFVNAAIKKAMCSEAGSDRAWLAKVRPWWGHAEHFHIRLNCPPDSPQCESQPPVPAGDGCGHALDYWFTAGVLHPKPPEKPPGPRTGPTLAALPAACKQVVKAP